MIRLYISEHTPPFTVGLNLLLNADQSRYLASVMRKVAGDEIALFNGRDGEWIARIAEVGKRAVRVELITQTRVQTTAEGPVLAVALIKRGPLETIVEKATELGVAKIQLLITRRSNSDHTRIDRLQLIAQEAAEQTERLDVPQILPPIKLEAFLGDPSCGAILFGDEDSTHDGNTTKPMAEVLKTLTALPAAILIGPEGGFDDAERQTLRNMDTVHPVNLGPRILRADTAAISALTLYQAVCGDWR
mgnify:CR=1 FL=1